LTCKWSPSPRTASCGNPALLREAIGLGANVVGGIPRIESGPGAAEHIRVCFDLAIEFEKDVSHLLWMTTRADMERLYDMVTVGAARDQPHRLRHRSRQQRRLVVLDAPDVLEALRDHARPAHVISQGRLVDAAAMRRLAQ